jgi:hypothetical protein
MTQDELIRMAQKAGLTDPDLGECVTDYGDATDGVLRFAKLVAAAKHKQWHGLTEEEKVNVAINCGCADVAWMDFADAIEAKLKEKNA